MTDPCKSHEERLATTRKSVDDARTTRPCRTSILCIHVAIACLVMVYGPVPTYAFEWLGQVTVVAKSLRSADPLDRLRAVQELQQFSIAWTRSYLLDALDDDDVRVRGAAATALTQGRALDVASVLYRWLAKPDPQEKTLAAELLGQLGQKEAVPHLVRSLGDTDVDVRHAAVLALGSIGTTAAIVPLVGRLEDDNTEVRLAAVQQLARLRDPRAIVSLVGLFSESSISLRVAAIAAVGDIGASTAVPALLRQLPSRAEEVRMQAIETLGVLRSVQALKPLTALLGQGSWAQQSQVILAIGRIIAGHSDDPAAQPLLRELVAALATPATQNAAREALLLVGRHATPYLVAHLQGDVPSHTTVVVELLARLKVRDATAPLLRELERGRIDRASVLRALNEIADERALVPLLSRLDQADPATKVLLLQNLGNLIGQDQGNSADILVDLLRDPDLNVRVLAAKYLGQMRAPAAVDELHAALTRRPNVALYQEIVTALGKIGSPRSIPVLIHELSHGRKSSRRLVTDALIRSSQPEAIQPLLDLVEKTRGHHQAHAVRALGAAVRNHHSESAAANTLRQLARRGDRPSAIAAIAALAAMRDGDSVGLLTDLARKGEPERAQSALLALGNYPRSERILEVVTERAAAHDDRVASAALWSLGKLRHKEAAPILATAASKRSFAIPINAAAALAMIGDKNHADIIEKLLFHKNPLVRCNAIEGANRAGLTSVRRRLEAMATRDSSGLVRAAAARSLSRFPNSLKLRQAIARSDYRPQVRTAAQETWRLVENRGQWRDILIVDPYGAQEPMPQEPYFMATSDGLVVALYTDSRGRLVEEQTPPGPIIVAPAGTVEHY